MDLYEDLKHKVVIVTGSSNGVGEAIVTLFAKLGCKVVVTARNARNVERVAKICEKVSPLNYKPLAVNGDLTVEEFPQKLVNQVVETFGKIDILVNNAAISNDVRILDENILDDFDKTVSIIVRAAVNLCHCALPHLIESNGAIVNVSATPKPLFYSVSMTKAALDMLTKTMALDFSPKGVRVNAVQIGLTNSETTRNQPDFEQFIPMVLPRIPLGRIAQADEIARPVVFLASGLASFITGALLPVDGGFVLS